MVMVNVIYVNGKLVFNDKPKKQFKNGYKIRCVKCNELVKRKWYEKKILETPYECKTCVLKYKNPMFDLEVKEKHRKIVKSDEYRKNMGNITSGEKNGFYGKKHDKEVVNKISENNKKYWQNITDEERKQWSVKSSIREKNRMKKDPVGYRKQKSNAGKASFKSLVDNFNKKMNKIEKIVYDYLTSINENVEFSPILASYQYDFIIRGKRILIEVDGDYWHGNPKFYDLNGTGGKRPLNEIQLHKKERDVEKTKWALSRNFKLIRIWEEEINNGTFKNKLKDL